MFKEVVNHDLRVQPPEFKCDSVISKNIKEPLPNTAFAMALIGSAGSGKTSLMVNMLTDANMYKQCYDHIHLIAPESSMKSLKDDVWHGHPEEKIHHTLDIGILDVIKDKTKERASAKKPETTLLIIDDMTIFLKHKEVEQRLRDLIFNRRHHYLSMLVLVQSYKAIPLDLRKTFSHFVLFKPRNKKEAEAIWEELLFLPKKVGNDLLQYTFRDQYDFLLGDCTTGDVYRNFNHVLINGEDGGGMLQDETEF